MASGGFGARINGRTIGLIGRAAGAECRRAIWFAFMIIQDGGGRYALCVLLAVVENGNSRLLDFISGRCPDPGAESCIPAGEGLGAGGPCTFLVL